jgi:hypothetical protein
MSDQGASGWIQRHPNLLAQDSHYAWGLAFTYASQVFFKSPLYGAAAILLISLIKEMTFDIIVERATVKGGLVD